MEEDLARPMEDRAKIFSILPSGLPAGSRRSQRKSRRSLKHLYPSHYRRSHDTVEHEDKPSSEKEGEHCDDNRHGPEAPLVLL